MSPRSHARAAQRGISIASTERGGSTLSNSISLSPSSELLARKRDPIGEYRPANRFEHSQASGSARAGKARPPDRRSGSARFATRSRHRPATAPVHFLSGAARSSARSAAKRPTNASTRNSAHDLALSCTVPLTLWKSGPRSRRAAGALPAHCGARRPTRDQRLCRRADRPVRPVDTGG